MYARIKSALVWGGLYIWINFILIGLLQLSLVCGWSAIENYIFTFPLYRYIWGIVLCIILITPINFQKYISVNQYLFFLYTGWLVYFYELALLFGIHLDEWLIALFFISTSIAVAKFENWNRGTKIMLIFFLWLFYVAVYLGNRIFTFSA